jgi:hypothetical protein
MDSQVHRPYGNPLSPLQRQVRFYPPPFSKDMRIIGVAFLLFQELHGILKHNMGTD